MTLANRIEAPQKQLMRACEYQTAVFDTGDAKNTTRFERPFDFVECIKWAVKRLQQGMAQAGVKLFIRKIQSVYVASLKLHIGDAVPHSVLLGIC